MQELLRDLTLGLVGGPSLSASPDDRLDPLGMECGEDHPEVLAIDPSGPSPLVREVIKDPWEEDGISPTVGDGEFWADRDVEGLDIGDVEEALPPGDDTLNKVQGTVGIRGQVDVLQEKED